MHTVVTFINQLLLFKLNILFNIHTYNVFGFNLHPITSHPVLSLTPFLFQLEMHAHVFFPLSLSLLLPAPSLSFNTY